MILCAPFGWTSHWPTQKSHWWDSGVSQSGATCLGGALPWAIAAVETSASSATAQAGTRMLSLPLPQVDELSTLPGRAPAPFHDVPDFAHAADISATDALRVRAAVAIGIEALGGIPQQLSLLRVGGAKCTPVLTRHIPIERRQAAVRADGDLAARARFRTIEAWPSRRGARPRWRARRSGLLQIRRLQWGCVRFRRNRRHRI